MELSNLARAIKAHKELESFDKTVIAIDNLKEQINEGNSQLFIGQYSDRSGIHLANHYVNGDYNVDLYTDLITAIDAIVKVHHKKLLKEISTL